MLLGHKITKVINSKQQALLVSSCRLEMLVRRYVLLVLHLNVAVRFGFPNLPKRTETDAHQIRRSHLIKSETEVGRSDTEIMLFALQMQHNVGEPARGLMPLRWSRVTLPDIRQVSPPAAVRYRSSLLDQSIKFILGPAP